MKDSKNIEPCCLYSPGTQGCHGWVRNRAQSKVLLLTNHLAINLSSFKQSFLIFSFRPCIFWRKKIDETLLWLMAKQKIKFLTKWNEIFSNYKTVFCPRLQEKQKSQWRLVWLYKRETKALSEIMLTFYTFITLCFYKTFIVYGKFFLVLISIAEISKCTVW